MTNYKLILDNIKTQNLGTIYALHGDEPYFIDILTKAFEDEALPPESQDFNKVVLFGNEIDWKRVVEEARRVPMFGDRTLVIVREANQMRGLDGLLSYIENPTPSTTLVIEHKGKKIDGKTKFYKSLSKAATIFLSEKMKEDQLVPYIISTGKSYGIEVSNVLAEKLWAHLGSDIQKINNEFQKIKISEPDIKALDAELIERYIGISREYNVIDLVNALMMRQRDKLASCLNYFAQNPKNAAAQPIVAVLYSFLSKALAAHYAKTFDEQKKLGVWTAHKNFAAQFSIAYIHELMFICHEFAQKAVGINYKPADGDTWIRDLSARISALLR